MTLHLASRSLLSPNFPPSSLVAPPHWPLGQFFLISPISLPWRMPQGSALGSILFSTNLTTLHLYKADSQISTSCLEHSSNFKFFCPTFYWTSPLRYAIYHNKLWNILQEMGIPDHPTYLLRNLYAGQEATVRTRHGKRDWFQIGKGVHQGCRLSPCLFNLQSTSGEMLGWIKHKLESRLPGEILITSDMQMTLPLWKKVKRNWKASWWGWKASWKWKRRVKKLA